MAGARFLVAGYGIAAAAGVWTGIQFGELAGWLTAWLGGSFLSLLFAYAWFWAERTGLLRSALPDKDTAPAASRRPRLVKVWDRELTGGSAATARQTRDAHAPVTKRRKRMLPGRGIQPAMSES